MLKVEDFKVMNSGPTVTVIVPDSYHFVVIPNGESVIQIPYDDEMYTLTPTQRVDEIVRTHKDISAIVESKTEEVETKEEVEAEEIKTEEVTTEEAVQSEPPKRGGRRRKSETPEAEEATTA